MKRFLWVFLVLTALGGGGYYYFIVRQAPRKEAGTGPVYEQGKVERRNLRHLVSATGTLAARDLVEVGTQVSGTLAQVLVDFNDRVEQGQLLASLDPSVLNAQVKSAEAALLRAQAQLLQARNRLERYAPVHAQGHLSDNDFEVYQIAVQTAEAARLEAEAGLDRAKQNRAYAEIFAPISGVVIDRAVEPGQTVAASLSAPRLFTIANDLAKMEIEAQVDESDIGQIAVGQPVRFTVAAFPDDNFQGTVEEIRLMPKVVQNVVNYTVVVTADNRRGQLLPGMTATLDFVVAEVDNVLSLPVSALSLRPNEEMQAVIEERRARRQAEARQADGEGGASRERGGGWTGRSGGGAESGGPGGGRRANFAMLWYYEDGKLTFMPVRKGVSDGIHTEVIPLREENQIEEGLSVIVKVTAPSSAPPRASSGSSGGLRRLGF